MHPNTRFVRRVKDRVDQAFGPLPDQERIDETTADTQAAWDAKTRRRRRIIAELLKWRARSNTLELPSSRPATG